MLAIESVTALQELPRCVLQHGEHRSVGSEEPEEL